MIRLQSGGDEAVIHEKGAYLAALRHSGRAVITEGDPSTPTKAGMAFLAPFANRVKGATYVFDGIVYSLPRNSEGNAIHGLLLDREFKVISSSADSVTLETVLSHPGYPSQLSVQVTYSISEGLLTAEAVIRNLGPRTAPLVVGWHPYFAVGNLPWRVEAEAFRCEAVDKIPTGKLYYYVFGDDGEYDDCFLVPSGLVKLIVNGREAVRVVSDSMRYFQIYTGIKGSVAIEPMSGAPDAYHNRMGLTVIEPSQSVRAGFKAYYS
ncbi:aldose 1-epimerase [Acidilobus sp.]|uniref:aldose 1-epimerase n=1 Tax=Acidilobus sp. TaxID=1872109 RepID=UPI003CFD607A